MLRYSKGLKFEEEPNYGMLRQLVKDMFKNEKLDYEVVFDWENRAAALERKSTFRHLSQYQLDMQKAHEGQDPPKDGEPR